MEEKINPVTAASPSHCESLAEQEHMRQWQKKLLPFLIGTPALLAIVFIFLATTQTMEFNSALQDNQKDQFIGGIIPSPKNKSFVDNDNYIKWTTLVYMEQENVKKRYRQAGFLLMSRVLTKYLGFFTGMIMAIVGAAFIIGKLSEHPSTLAGELTNQFKFNIASTSPGLIFGVLGTLLMLATILSHSDIAVVEQPMYLNANNIMLINPNLVDQNTKAIVNDEDVQKYIDSLATTTKTVKE